MPGQRLVAAGEQHRAVEPLGEHHGLDRVGDDLAGDQRGPHALVAHRDAVGDRDRAELQRVAAGRVHPLLGPLGQPVEGEVAGGDLVPRRGDPDLRLVPVVVAHADGAQHGARGGRRPRRSPRGCGASHRACRVRRRFRSGVSSTVVTNSDARRRRRLSSGRPRSRGARRPGRGRSGRRRRPPRRVRLRHGPPTCGVRAAPGPTTGGARRAGARGRSRPARHGAGRR